MTHLLKFGHWPQYEVFGSPFGGWGKVCRKCVLRVNPANERLTDIPQCDPADGMNEETRTMLTKEKK